MLNQLYGSNGQATVDLTQGLVAHYLINNNGDDNYNIYDGTPSGGVDFQGDVAKFDGTNRIALTQYFSTITQGVISLYSRGSGIAFGIGYSGVATNVFYISVGTEVTLRVKNTTTGVFDNTIVTVGASLVSTELYNITVSSNGSSYKITVNGIEQTLSASLGVNNGKWFSNLDYTNLNAYYIGSVTLGAENYYFNGTISNFRIYNEAKDQAFVDALYAEGYYPKPLSLPTTDGLIAHYPLTGTAEDTTGNYNSTEVSATYKDDAEFGSVYDGGGSITINTTATGLAVWCCYWIDTGTGWVFTKTTTIPSTLTTNDYRNLRLYSLTPSVALQDEIEEYEKNFRPIDIDDGLVAYYPLANNSLDNYNNQYDGVDTSMTYDGLSGVFNGTSSRIALPDTISTSTTTTISVWVNVDKVDALVADYIMDSTNRFIISNGESTSSSKISFYDGSAWHYTTTDFTVGLTQHLVVIANNTSLEIYLDNILIYSTTILANSIGTSCKLGCRYDTTTTAYFSGDMAHFRVYNKAITPEQVEVIYNTEKGDFGL